MTMEKYLTDLIQKHPALQTCRLDILRAARTMSQSLKDGGKILLCGNGGSAADAEHWAGELLKRFETDRPSLASVLPDHLAAELERAIPAIPLTSFPSFQSAWANDRNADYNFAQLTQVLGREGDVLVGISTSGNARNVNLAFETARALGIKTIGLTGETGGRMQETADLLVRIPAESTADIQELHLPVYHAICRMLDA